MDELKRVLTTLKEYGCSGIKISFEDEGALLNEVTTMRYLTADLGISLSIKIGGCEAKRDIVDSMNVYCDSIVAPMIESAFALRKFTNSLKQYGYYGERGINIETIDAYTKIDEISKDLSQIDFVTVGRVDLVGSLGQTRDSVNSAHILEIVKNVFGKVREHGKQCCLGGAVSVASKQFIKDLIDDKLIDRFETRYIICNADETAIANFENIIYLANIFEIQWLTFIKKRYNTLCMKDCDRIQMLENRVNGI